MISSKQATLFEFDSVEEVLGPTWLENYDGEHASMYRMDAEALVEDLNRIPSRKGSWLRCLEVDHERSYESQFKKWDACIWFQRGMGIKKMVKSTEGHGLHRPASVQMALPER